MIAKKVPEKLVQDACLEYLAMKKVFYFRLNNIPVSVGGKFRAQSPHTPKGLPDAVVILNGQFIGLEFKGSDGKLSDDQVDCHDRIYKAGGEVFVIRSIDDLQLIGL